MIIGKPMCNGLKQIVTTHTRIHMPIKYILLVYYDTLLAFFDLKNLFVLKNKKGGWNSLTAMPSPPPVHDMSNILK